MTILFAKSDYSYFVLLSFNGIADPIAVFPRTKAGQTAAELVIDVLATVNSWPVEIL